MKIFKSAYIISAAIGLAGIVSSCDLDLTPESSLSPETYFRKAADLELATNRFYLQEPEFDDIASEPSDLVVDKGASNSLYYSNMRTVPGSGGGWSWGDLRHINYYLEHSVNCEDIDARNQYDAVARFWRAWFYFNKVKRYGDVPWHNRALGSSETEFLNKPRDSRALVVDSILADLDFAAKFLPESSDGFHLNRYAAVAFRSRVCLYEGTFRKYHAGDVFNPDNLPWRELLQQAAEAAEEIISSKKYSIAKSGNTPYYSLFVAEEANTAEYIFARSYGGTITSDVNLVTFSGGGNKSGATKALVASYLMKDGSRFTDIPGWETMEIPDEFKNRDPRLTQTIAGPGFQKWDTGEKFDYKIVYSETCYPLVKCVQGPLNQKSATQDMPIIRYAEVLLNYAEAKAELETLTQEDLENSIALIRARVGMPCIDMAAANANPDPFLCSPEYGYVNVTGANKGVILEIRRERAIELVKEGFRWPDLMRWREGQRLTHEFTGAYFKGAGAYDLDGDGKQDFAIYKDRPIRVTGVTPKKIGTDIYLTDGDNSKGYVLGVYGITHAFNEERDYLFPLPTDDIQLSGGTLKQNPGW
ncbi:MAG: RagB/SusD family nutrient uptake outer membrane protein [Bacteroidales bacterium]|nr:RagB/SusD family nutrient uptake outer membrane protein [Bacteroidales bacterium]